MGTKLRQLLENNREWARQMTEQDPEFFSRLSAQQKPRFLWIGCADSRMPSTQLVNLAPGEMFVHRNVANLVVHSDLNCLSVIEFAVDILNVEHILIVGHYGCGGVTAAIADTPLRLASSWLRHVRDVEREFEEELTWLSPEQKIARMCELNVISQVRSTAETPVVRDAWRNGRNLAIHGWIYDIKDGHLRDLEVTMAPNAGDEPE